MFGGASAAIGQTVQLNSVPFTVVGVTESSFEGAGSTAKFWIPGRAYHRVRHFAANLWTYEVNRGPFSPYLFRMTPGTPPSAAEAELRSRTAQLAASGKAGADLFKTVSVRVMPGFGAPRSVNTGAVEVVRQLAAIAGVLVLLGIANMANLLIFQGLKLSREVAIRKALGASVARLIQLTLIESVLLSAVGAVAGIGVALAIPELLAGISVPGIGAIIVPIDWRVLGGTIALAIATGVTFGVGPALLSARGSTLAALGRGLRAELPRIGRLRQGLAAVQLALSLVLLIGAFLFLSTLRNLRGVDLGFDATNVTTMQMDLRSHGYDAPRIFAYYQRLIELIKAQPGVDEAAVAYALPVAGMSFSSSLYLPGNDPKAAPEILFNYVSSGYFDVLRVPIARGRAFTAAESFGQDGGGPIILSAGAARLLFGDADPLGRVVTEPGRGGGDHTVIGVTAEGRWRSAAAPPDPIAYQPFGPGIAVTGAAIIVRSSRPGSEVVKAIQDAGASIDRATPLFLDRSMTQILDGRLARQRLFAWVLGLLGVIGFALAAVGLHSLIAQMVAERAREFGIRVAIGASRRDVVNLVARQAGIVAGLGIAAGIGAALVSGKLIEASLFGVTSRDSLVYASATGLLLAVVALALIGPARAALRVEPIAVLRND
jgi:predicted permease